MLASSSMLACARLFLGVHQCRMHSTEPHSPSVAKFGPGMAATGVPGPWRQCQTVESTWASTMEIYFDAISSARIPARPGSEWCCGQVPGQLPPACTKIHTGQVACPLIPLPLLVCASTLPRTRLLKRASPPSPMLPHAAALQQACHGSLYSRPLQRSFTSPETLRAWCLLAPSTGCTTAKVLSTRSQYAALAGKGFPASPAKASGCTQGEA